jgi:hypothetical protein
MQALVGAAFFSRQNSNHLLLHSFRVSKIAALICLNTQRHDSSGLSPLSIPEDNQSPSIFVMPVTRLKVGIAYLCQFSRGLNHGTPINQRLQVIINHQLPLSRKKTNRRTYRPFVLRPMKIDLHERL